MADQLHLKLWELISRLSKSKKVTGDSQHGLPKQITPDWPEHVCDEKTGSAGKGRAEDVAYLDFSL